MGILSVILAIVAVAIALLGPLLLGVTGGTIAAILAIVAIALAVFKRIKSKKGGIAGIVIGAIAVILSFSMTKVTSTMFTELHNKAIQYKPDGLWAQVSEDTNHGMMGIINNLPTDDATLNALVDEMNELNKVMDK